MSAEDSKIEECLNNRALANIHRSNPLFHEFDTFWMLARTGLQVTENRTPFGLVQPFDLHIHRSSVCPSTKGIKHWTDQAEILHMASM